MLINSLPVELEKTKEDLLRMGRLVQEQIIKSVKALVEKDMDLAREVIANDNIVDQMELDLEKKCLGLIALKQPMAKDLRLIGTVLRIIVDIERMGDLAEDIAEIAVKLYEQTYIKPLIDIPRMARLAEDMIETALRAFIDQDVSLAMKLIPMETEMDALYNQVFSELLVYMMKDQGNIAQSTALLLIAVHLERFGDHATNLAEMVIYVEEGRRVDLNELARNE
ncbi:MAG: phosphate signaling complex protein PhoU [Syntrophomonas sp.]